MAEDKPKQEPTPAKVEDPIKAREIENLQDRIVNAELQIRETTQLLESLKLMHKALTK